MNKRTDLHAAALANFLGLEASDLTPTFDHYGLKQYDSHEATYAIGTGDEASDASGEYIRESVWAFSAEFLCSVCGLSPDLAPMLRAYQEKECENANEGLLGLVERCADLAELQDAAEGADGRGHFLSPYNGVEEEHTYENEDGDGDTFYIYRTN
jgi:hypothetical protein